MKPTTWPCPISVSDILLALFALLAEMQCYEKGVEDVWKEEGNCLGVDVYKEVWSPGSTRVESKQPGNKISRQQDFTSTLCCHNKSELPLSTLDDKQNHATSSLSNLFLGYLGVLENRHGIGGSLFRKGCPSRLIKSLLLPAHWISRAPFNLQFLVSRSILINFWKFLELNFQIFIDVDAQLDLLSALKKFHWCLQLVEDASMSSREWLRRTCQHHCPPCPRQRTSSDSSRRLAFPLQFDH